MIDLGMNSLVWKNLASDDYEKPFTFFFYNFLFLLGWESMMYVKIIWGEDLF